MDVTASTQLQEQIKGWQAALEHAGDAAGKIALLEQIGTAQCVLKEAAAVKTFEQAVEIAKQQGDSSAETFNTLRLAATMQHLNHIGAISRYEQALDLCRQQIAQDTCLQTLAEYYVKLGRYEEAISLFEQALTLRQVTGNMALIETTQRALSEARKRVKEQVAPASTLPTPQRPVAYAVPTLPKVSWIERVSYRSYAVAQIIFFALLMVILGLNGFSTLDVIAVLVLIVASVALQRVLRTRPTEAVSQYAQIAETLNNGAKYTLVELYGTYCAGCAMMNPLVDGLEREGNPKLQVLRLNIETPPGLFLKPEKTTFTPLFQLYDPHGNKIRETYMVLDRARILYEVERLSRGSGPLVMP